MNFDIPLEGTGMTVGDGCKVGISKIQTSQVGMFCTFMVIPVCQLTAPGEIEIFEGVHYSKVLVCGITSHVWSSAMACGRDTSTISFSYDRTVLLAQIIMEMTYHKRNLADVFCGYCRLAYVKSLCSLNEKHFLMLCLLNWSDNWRCSWLCYVLFGYKMYVEF